MLPLWADIAILLALPVLVLGAVWKWGDDEPDNAIVHTSDDPQDEDPGDVLIAA